MRTGRYEFIRRDDYNYSPRIPDQIVGICSHCACLTDYKISFLADDLTIIVEYSRMRGELNSMVYFEDVRLMNPHDGKKFIPWEEYNKAELMEFNNPSDRCIIVNMLLSMFELDNSRTHKDYKRQFTESYVFRNRENENTDKVTFYAIPSRFRIIISSDIGCSEHFSFVFWELNFDEDGKLISAVYESSKYVNFEKGIPSARAHEYLSKYIEENNIRVDK